VPVERSDEHPVFELGGNQITSFAAPSRGAADAALYRIDLPPGSGVPRHHHDHLDVFTVAEGRLTVHLGDSRTEVATGDSVVVPAGDWHHFVAGPDGASVIVTMLPGTKLVREDGSAVVPPWVS
jgi:quercetin dioxygenase-like cupin family protein